MAEARGIKEMSELAEGIKVIGVAAKEVLKDGEITAADGIVVFKVMQSPQVLIDAFTGLADIDDEIKDLSLDELQQMFMKLVEAAKAIKAA